MAEFAPILLLLFAWIFVGLPISIAKKAANQKKQVRPVRPEDICFLTEAEPIPAGMLQDVLKQHQIPALTSSTVGAGMAMKAGNVFERIKFFVRYEHLEKAKQFAAELFDPADNE